MRRRAFLEFVFPPELRRKADPDHLAELLVPIFGHDLAEMPRVALRQGIAMTAYDGRRRLEKLASLPTLVVSAEHDPIACPRVGRRLADGIPGARFVEIPRAAHGVTIQCQETINRLLREHFARRQLVEVAAS